MSLKINKNCQRICQLLSIFVFAAFINFQPIIIPESFADGIGGIPEDFQVSLNKSRVISLTKSISKVSMGNPNIADIVILRGSQIYILGKQLGTTNVQLWDKNNDLVKVLDIEVTHDLYQVKKKLHELLPNEKIGVFSSNKSIVLKGQVSNLVNMDMALKVAKSFSRTYTKNSSVKGGGEGEKGGGNTEKEDNIINLMSVGGSQQVMIKVTVAELERTTIKKMGIKWYASDLDGSWGYGGLSGGFSSILPPELSIADKGLFASYIKNDFFFNLALEAAKDDGTAKVLAEPTVTALSGEKAKFLSGGEFPIPIQQRDGITVSFKEYGIGVEFIPTVLSSGHINLNLSVSVSELTNSGSSSFGTGNIPALVLRSTSTTVELADGQSIGLAGLISEDMRGIVNKFPGLGDIPILGQLFRSEEFVRGETELVIMVTPVLVAPMNKTLTHLPTDSFVEPSDIAFYVLGSIHGRQKKSNDRAVTDTNTQATTSASVETDITSNSGGVDGQFGHSVE